MSVKVDAPDVSANRETLVGRSFVCDLSPGGVDSTWVRVAGDLDMSTAPRLALALRQAEWWRLVIVDLRELSFLDTSGVHVVVDATTRMRQGGRQLVLIRGPVQVDRLFTLCGVSDAVTIVDPEWPGLRRRVWARHTPPDEAA